MKKNLTAAALIILGIVSTVIGQNKGNEASADRTLRGSGRVNESTLGMEFDLPLAGYTGRGINVPINLSYSSKLWRMKYLTQTPIPGGNWSPCYSQYIPVFAEESASGWTSSLAVPYIEYIGADNRYLSNGAGATYGDVDCPGTGGNESPPHYYVRRLLVHLPGGQTHEVRADDTVIGFTSNGQSDPNGPYQPYKWNATFYAADSSNIKYVQDSNSGTYRLLMPDGSFYDFDASTPHGVDRKAVKFTDRNGNFTTYYGPGSVDNNNVTHPNGYWKDTLGRNISIPLGPQAPSVPTPAGSPQIYAMPGMTGTYKLHWKKLKGSTAAESGLTNFSDDLRYYGDRYVGGPGACGNQYPTFCYHTAAVLFSGTSDTIILSSTLFNPVVLTDIELPTGQKYAFSYDVYGRIEKISYPTGGEEKLQYSVVPTLSMLEPDDIGGQSNFGVTDRKVHKFAGDPAPYQWTYSANYIAPSGYQVNINNPDGTRVERYLRRGNDAGMTLGGTFGYDNGLAGMAYEERGLDSSNPRKLVSKKLMSWTVMQAQLNFGTATAHWHPRVTHEESYIYDNSGNGVSASSAYEYEDESNLTRDKPILQKKSSQYAFVAAGSAPPQVPVRTSESTFLINDNSIPQTIRDVYKAQNMVGLATVSVIKDSAGAIVSRTEMLYDEAGYSPNVGRGNPTTARVWDSTKGNSTNPAAYISTHAKFDTYGNQYESIDARGNSTVTEYDSTHSAFPVKVTTAVPDPTGQKGSNSAFISTATYDFTSGLPLTTTDVNGLEIRIQYDPVNLRLLNTKSYHNGIQVGSTVETVYHDETNNYWIKNRSQINATNWAETTTYLDGLGRAYRAEQVDSEGNIFVDKEFDVDGRVLRVSNPYRANETKIWTTNVYDEASRIREVILPDGSKVKTDYGVSTSEAVGVTKQITDQAGKKRKGFSDALGRMIRVSEDPAGQNLITDYVFDTLGNLRKTVQGGQSRYFSYDSLGRILRAKQPEQEVNTALAMSSPDSVTGHNQWSASYEYDDNGNITKTTDARGVFIQATYDNFNRLTFRNYSDSTPDANFYYDGTGLGAIPNFSKGKPTKVTNGISETRYKSFDAFGRVLTHEQRTTPGQLAGTEPAYTTGYSYNLSGALIEETYPSGRVVKNTLNQDGELVQVLSRKNASHGFVNYASGFKYNSAGAVEKMKLGNGRWETAQYNNRLQVTQMGLGTTDVDQNLLKLEYGYGNNTQNNGSLKSQKISFNGLSQAFEQTYTYDDLNRIQVAEEKVGGATNWKQTFLYDRFGNRRFDAANTTTLPQSNNITNPTIDTATNRFTSGQNYSYDKTGNLTIDAEGRQFFYDAENHQTEVRNAAQSTIGLYEYDGDGRRVKKSSSTDTSIFVYNAGGMLVAEYSTQLAPTQQVSYLTTDHLGSPRVITDQNGAITTRTDYAAFGDAIYTANRTTGLGYDGVSETRKGYTGYEKDDESGLDFAQARYYNASHGRFTSVDPLTASATIKNPQTFNRYSYVLNSPYKFTDPLGLIPRTTGANGGTAWCSTCKMTDDNGGFIDEPILEEEPQNSPDHAPAISEETQATNQEAKEPDPPNLPDDVVTESETERLQYNCLAWALGFTDVWIDPVYYDDGSQGGGYKEERNRDSEGNSDKTYLPMGEYGKSSLPPYSFVQTAKAYGAEQNIKVNGQKTKASLEIDTPDGYYKMVVFEGRNPKQSHVMRQDSDGTWSSKNGSGDRVTGIKDPEAYYKDNYKPDKNVKSTYLFRKTERLGKR